MAVTWTDVVAAVGTILIPVVVANYGWLQETRNAEEKRLNRLHELYHSWINNGLQRDADELMKEMYPYTDYAAFLQRCKALRENPEKQDAIRKLNSFLSDFVYHMPPVTSPAKPGVLVWIYDVWSGFLAFWWRALLLACGCGFAVPKPDAPLYLQYVTEEEAFGFWEVVMHATMAVEPLNWVWHQLNPLYVEMKAKIDSIDVNTRVQRHSRHARACTIMLDRLPKEAYETILERGNIQLYLKFLETELDVEEVTSRSDSEYLACKRAYKGGKFSSTLYKKRDVAIYPECNSATFNQYVSCSMIVIR